MSEKKSGSLPGQYIKVDNEKIKLKAPGFVSTKMIGLYSMLETYLSNPDFEYCNGGLKKAVMSHCKNQKMSFNRVWNSLFEAGYLKRVRIPYEKNKFRDFYELNALPVLDIPAVRNMTAGEGKRYLSKKPVFMIPKENYTGIPVSVLMDERLSLMAKGLYHIILRLILIAANKPDLLLTKELLLGHTPEGATAFNNAWKQLKDFGYLELKRIYDTDLKRLRYVYRLNGSPYEQNEKKKTPANLPCAAEKRVARKNPGLIESFCEKTAEISSFDQPFQKNSSQVSREGDNELFGIKLYSPPVYTPENQADLLNQIRYQIQYDWQLEKQGHSKTLVDSLVHILFDTAIYNSRKRAGKTDTGAALATLFKELDFEDADFAMTRFEQAAAQSCLKNPTAYLRVILSKAKQDLILSRYSEEYLLSDS